MTDISVRTPIVTTHALVTGASSGIGAAFANELAARGHNLVLTARRGDRLEALAAEIRAAHAVDVQCIVADLADADAPALLFDECARRELAIDVLVNNAGYGVTGTLIARPWPTHRDFIQVMMTAPTELCHRFLPAMRARGHGRIVNIASLAGLVPAPAGHTLYAASKIYLIRFSQALALESRDADVNVCALCPGFTYSEFHDVNGARAKVKGMPAWLWLHADTVARDGLDAVERGDVVRVVGGWNRAIYRLFAWLPDRFALAMIDRRGKDFRVTDAG